MSNDGIKAQFISAGAFYASYIHIFLQTISDSSAILYHALTFVLYFIPSIFLYYTLPYLKVEKNSRFIITAFFTILPINFARIYMICFPYTLGLFFCFAAIYSFTVAFYERKLSFRIISLICCILSFGLLQSVFVFIPAYIAFVIILNAFNSTLSISKNIRNIFIKTLKHADFIVLTLLCWILLSIFTKPSGFHAIVNYNEFSLKSIVSFPINLLKSFAESFCKLADFTNHLFIFFIFGIITALLLFVFRNKKDMITTNKFIIRFSLRKRYVNLSAFTVWGLYFFIAGAFAYLMVGKTPQYLNPQSRYQILLGAGMSLLLLDFLITCFNFKYVKYVFIVLLSLCITSNIDQCLMFQKSHYKQLSMMTEMEKEENIINNRNFMLIDNTLHYNETTDVTRFYVFTGLAKKVFGNEKRLIIEQYFYKDTFFMGKLDFLQQSGFHNIGDISFDGAFDYYIIVEQGAMKFTYFNLLKMMAAEHFNKEKFTKDITKLIKLTCIPYQNNLTDK
jgi:hypothetical protein